MKVGMLKFHCSVPSHQNNGEGSQDFSLSTSLNWCNSRQFIHVYSMVPRGTNICKWSNLLLWSEKIRGTSRTPKSLKVKHLVNSILNLGFLYKMTFRSFHGIPSTPWWGREIRLHANAAPAEVPPGQPRAAPARHHADGVQLCTDPCAFQLWYLATWITWDSD